MRSKDGDGCRKEYVKLELPLEQLRNSTIQALACSVTSHDQVGVPTRAVWRMWGRVRDALSGSSNSTHKQVYFHQAQPSFQHEQQHSLDSQKLAQPRGRFCISWRGPDAHPKYSRLMAER